MSKDIVQKKVDTPPTPSPVAPAAGDERGLFWIGCDLDGPQHRYQLAGTTFQHSVDKQINGQVSTTSVAQLGAIEYLTSEQVGRIKRHANREVVRVFKSEDGKIGKQLLAATTRRYIREAGDYPVGRHVYMVPVQPGFIAPHIDGSLPDRILGEGEWTQPSREEDPVILAERERAKIQAEAIAQAVVSLHAAAK